MRSLNGIAHSDPEILHGATVFIGTRVPVRALFEHIEGGDTVDEFLSQFPSVSQSFSGVGGSRCGDGVSDT